MGAILLPIRPVYADKILDGSKRFEFRRQAAKDVDRLVLYATAPTRMVVGEVEVLDVMSASRPHQLWALTLGAAPGSALFRDEAAAWETPHPEAGVAADRFKSYFRTAKKCFAYVLGAAERYDPPRPLDCYGLSRAPQNVVRLWDDTRW